MGHKSTSARGFEGWVVCLDCWMALAIAPGSSLGATVYAVAACDRTPGWGEDDLVAALSRHGADKVLLAAGPAHAGPLRWGGHGALLSQAPPKV